MKHVYTSIDIGSDTVKIAVCELYKNKLNLLAASSVKSKGIKKGLITDVYEATNSIKKAISEIEEMLGIKIKKVIASVPSYFAEFGVISGQIEISDDTPITGSDISKVLQKGINIPSNKEVVAILPISFTIDDEENVKYPCGLIGSKLSARAVLVTTPKKNIYSVVNLLESIGIEVVDITTSSISDIYVFKNKDIDSSIGALINIGSDTTTISVYNKGIVVKQSILQSGGKLVDKDISYVYKIGTKEARKIKEKFALAHKRHAGVNDTYETTDNDGQVIRINQFEVSEVSMLRIEDMLINARKEINMLTNKPMNYVIITGGLTNMEDFNIIAEEVFGSNVIVGNLKLVGVRNNKFSTTIGNIIYFVDKLKLQDSDYTMISKSDVEELSSTKKNVIPNDSMLGKVFGYFFNE